jgi:hypothetical protein
VGVLRGILNLCTQREMAIKIGQQYVRRFEQHGASSALISVLTRIIDMHGLPSLPRKVSLLSCNKSSNLMFIVLPFHPIWYRGGVGVRIIQFVRSPDSINALLAAGLSDIGFSIAWSNSLRPAHIILGR